MLCTRSSRAQKASEQPAGTLQIDALVYKRARVVEEMMVFASEAVEERSSPLSRPAFSDQNSTSSSTHFSFPLIRKLLLSHSIPTHETRPPLPIVESLTMPLTLVTGATGFVGSSIVAELLSQRHTLILAVRSTHSAQSLLSNNPSWPRDRTTLVSVPDFTAPGAFDHVFQTYSSIEYILHVAAPMLDHPDNNDFVEHFEKPSVLGNTGLLRSAKEFGKNVKAISVTGSLNAISTGSQDDIKSRAFTTTEWLPLGSEDAIKANNNYVRSSFQRFEKIFDSVFG
jgi:hypothetical protein